MSTAFGAVISDVFIAESSSWETAQADQRGHWMGAVLACGPSALLSHLSAAQLWGIVPPQPGRVEVSVPYEDRHRPSGVLVHRRRTLTPLDRRALHGIPVTRPARTLADIASRISTVDLEAAVNQADKLDWIDPERLRLALSEMGGEPGTRVLLRLLDRRVFRLTDSELERRFLRLVIGAGLPTPQTGVCLQGYRADFFWPDLGLAVETDGLRYHRTPAQQARDRRRDQVLTASGLTVLRFTHAQIRFEPEGVRVLLVRVIERLAGRRRAA